MSRCGEGLKIERSITYFGCEFYGHLLLVKMIQGLLAFLEKAILQCDNVIDVPPLIQGRSKGDESKSDSNFSMTIPENSIPKGDPIGIPIFPRK